VAVDPHVSPKLYDRPRSGTPMPPARSFRAVRPGEVVQEGQPTGPLLGAPGPDIGYGMLLARRFADRLELAPHEHLDDALLVGAEVAMRRAATIGRAPVIRDLEWAFTLLGYLGDAPSDLVEWRRHEVRHAGHNYAERRSIVGAVTEAAIPLSAEEVRGRLSDWRSLVDPHQAEAAAEPAG